MMHRFTAAASIVAAAFALTACGVRAPDSTAAQEMRYSPRVLVELQALPDGHPPVPGFDSEPTLPEGHPPLALPDGHPRCPARGQLMAPPAAEAQPGLQSARPLIST